MKLSKSKLRQIIKEELDNILGEDEGGYNDEPLTAQEWLNTQDLTRVRGNDTEGYMRLVSLLTTKSPKYRRELRFDPVEDSEAREMIDAAKEESNIKSAERSRKWKEENPDTRTKTERDDDARRGEAAYHAAERSAGRNPTYGT